MKKVVIFLLMLHMLLLHTKVNVCAVERESEVVMIDEHSLFSQAAVLMDARNGRVLFGKNQDMQLAMASTTKIMTCIMALEKGDKNDLVTISSYAASQPKVKLYLNKGERVRLNDLLYSLMLESHNDTAVAIAEHIGAKLLNVPNDPESAAKRTVAESQKAVKAFIDCMNQKARELQCYHTWFITPNGLDATETFYENDKECLQKIHSTTATELARMMSYCILQSPEKEAFLKITGTYTYTFSNADETKSYTCSNHNAFLNMMDGAISGKTGYTGRAGYCYVGALERDGRYYVAALLNTGAYGNGNKNNKWKDMKKLMDYGLRYYKYETVYDGLIQAKPVIVLNAKKSPEKFYEDKIICPEISCNEAVEILLADWEKAEIKMIQEKKLIAPVSKGQKIGKVEVYLEKLLLKQFDIIILEDIEEQKFSDILHYLIRKFCCLNIHM